MEAEAIQYFLNPQPQRVDFVRIPSIFQKSFLYFCRKSPLNFFFKFLMRTSEIGASENIFGAFGGTWL
jgi:hypothetical protein